jgi:peroxiredoxin
MPKIQLDTQSPDFTLISFDGHKISLSDFRGNSQVLLVFNRGFV